VAPKITGPGGPTNLDDGRLSLNGVQDYPALTTEAGITTLNNVLGSGASSIVTNGTTHSSRMHTLRALTVGATGVVVVGGPFAAAAVEFAAEEGFGESALLGSSAAMPKPGSSCLLLLGAIACCATRTVRMSR
jgi:hypothetical protein